MRIVVDTNILFTFFWKNSIFENIIKKDNDFFAPEYALEEINKHACEIKEKTSISDKKFRDLRIKLALNVGFIPLEEYSDYFSEVMVLSKGLKNKEYDEFIKDIDFLALALKLNCPIWTNDKQFKNQSKILVFNTKEMIELINIK